MIMRMQMSYVVCILAGVACLAATAEAAEGFQPYRIPEPTWAYDGAVATGGRKMLQVGQALPSHSGSTNCTVKITGTGQLFGVASASVKCDTTDKAYTSGGVTIFAGKPLVDLYNKDDGTNFKGVKLQLPNEANFLSQGNMDPVLFFVQNGEVKLTGYVRKMSVLDWAVIHVENGTNMTISNFEWSDNHGERFPTLAVARSSTKVSFSHWTNNVCTNVTRCHTAGAYVTEGARISISNSKFQGNKGHLAGAVMITSGALGTIEKVNFTQNSVVNNGDFGGAIFHDFCDKDARTMGKQSTFTGNKFTNNTSQGFGGAIRIGSPDGGCRPSITNNIFKGNKAKYTGGAIHFSYCSGKSPFLSGNTFASNSASMFNGQVGFNPTTYPSGQPGAGSATPAAAGCAHPNTVKSTWSGSAPKFSPPWFFP